MPQSTTRASRLEARISPEALALVRRAAQIQGRSISDFVVSAAQEAARQAIEEAHVLRLAVEDQEALAAALLDPPEPNDALRRAAAAHRRLIISS